jgi:hypothetical protein
MIDIIVSIKIETVVEVIPASRSHVAAPLAFAHPAPSPF